MRIGIDARLYGREGRGLGRYVSQLLLHLEGIDRENEYIVFLTKKGIAEYQPAVDNFKKVLCDIPWYGVREQVALPRLIASHHCDLVHFPHFNVPVFYREKFVVTIHDFILYDFPTVRATTRSALTFWIKYAAYRFVFWSAVQRARHIFVPSTYVYDRLLYHYPSITESNVTVTEEGSLRPHPSLLLQGEGTSLSFEERTRVRSKDYVLVVGSAYPHKNLEALIEAFNVMRSDLVKLFIVGKKDYFMRRLEKKTSLQPSPPTLQSGRAARRGGKGAVEFVEEVGDRELSSLYAHARAVCVVSCEEGFGLPGAEALAYGVPVVASDRSSLPEVYRDRAYYVNPYDVGDIARVLKEVLARPHPRPLLKGEGSSFSLQEKAGMRFGPAWQKLAEATKAVYESIG